MPASVEFAARVYALVARVPRGRVTTYGRVARALGDPRGARMVGWALSGVPPGLELPCQRVVNRNGELSGGWHFGHPDVMRALLEEEGVPFAEAYRVDLARCVWDPGTLESLPATDEVDDFEAVAVGERGGGEGIAGEDGAVELDDDELRLEAFAGDEAGDGGAGRDGGFPAVGDDAESRLVGG